MRGVKILKTQVNVMELFYVFFRFSLQEISEIFSVSKSKVEALSSQNGWKQKRKLSPPISIDEAMQDFYGIIFIMINGLRATAQSLDFHEDNFADHVVTLSHLIKSAHLLSDLGKYISVRNTWDGLQNVERLVLMQDRYTQDEKAIFVRMLNDCREQNVLLALGGVSQ